MIHAGGALPPKLHKLLRGLLAQHHPTIAALLGTTLPDAVDLAAWQPPIMDQGPTGSCTAHSAASGVATALAKSGATLGFVPSPDEIYKATRAIPRAAAAAAGAMLPVLTDSGAELADALRALADWGVCAIHAPTADGRYSDVDPNTVNAEPNTVRLEQAATQLVTGAYRVDPGASNASDQVAAALASGFPIYTGFYVDSAFESLRPQDVAQPPNQSDPNGGGHAVYLSGYRTVGSARQFLLTNSWSGSWCNYGRCWVSEAWVKATWEMWVLDVQVVSQ